MTTPATTPARTNPECIVRVREHNDGGVWIVESFLYDGAIHGLADLRAAVRALVLEVGAVDGAATEDWHVERSREDDHVRWYAQVWFRHPKKWDERPGRCDVVCVGAGTASETFDKLRAAVTVQVQLRRVLLGEPEEEAC